jgi:hypothetical protein
MTMMAVFGDYDAKTNNYESELDIYLLISLVGVIHGLIIYLAMHCMCISTRFFNRHNAQASAQQAVILWCFLELFRYRTLEGRRL